MKKRIVGSVVAVSFVACLSGSAFAAPAAVPAQTVVAAPGERAAPDLAAESKSEAQAYGARQSATKNLDSFRGGEGAGIYIGGGALSVALLIVLLIVIF